jgi:integrase
MRGDGFLFLQRGIWYACTFRDGRRVRESLGTADRAEAERQFARIRRSKERGAYLLPTERRILVDELLDDLLVHLENKGAVSAPKVRSHLKAARLELGHLRAGMLDTATVERAQHEWRHAGDAPATINRRCEALRQAYRLAARRTPPKVRVVPHIPLLKVSNARQGFLGRADFEALLRHLPDADVRDFLEWFFWTAMRPGEIRELTWPMFDRETWTLSLDPRAAKTRRGRAIAVEGPLRAIIERRLRARRMDTQRIFHRVSHRRPGQPVRDFRVLWKAALRAAKLAPGLLPYDLRRTALRNMVRAGGDVTTVMAISGHRTRSTFDRYNITATEDIAEVVRLTAAYVDTLPKRRKVREHEPKR